MVQQVLLGRPHHFGRPRPRGRDAFAEDKGFTWWRVLCHRCHADAIHPVDTPGELVIFSRIFTDKIAHHAFDFLQKSLMARDEARIGSAAEQDRALAHMPRPLDLDPWLPGLLPDRADDAGAPVVEGMIRGV